MKRFILSIFISSISIFAHTITNEDKIGRDNYTFSGYCSTNGLFQGNYNSSIPSAYACGPNGCIKAKTKKEVINKVCAIKNKEIFIINNNEAKQISISQFPDFSVCKRSSVNVANLIIKSHQKKLDQTAYNTCKKRSSNVDNGDTYHSLIFNGSLHNFKTNKYNKITGITAENLTKSQGSMLIKYFQSIYPNQMNISHYNTYKGHETTKFHWSIKNKCYNGRDMIIKISEAVLPDSEYIHTYNINLTCKDWVD